MSVFYSLLESYSVEQVSHTMTNLSDPVAVDYRMIFLSLGIGLLFIVIGIIIGVWREKRRK